MAVKIRLARRGAKKKPFYRIVAVDSASRRDGRALDYVGYYNPMTEPADIKIDQDKVKNWIELGAQPTDTVRSLLKKSGFSK